MVLSHIMGQLRQADYTCYKYVIRPAGGSWMIDALVISFWYPLTGLIILAVSMVFGPLASRLTYME